MNYVYLWRVSALGALMVAANAGAADVTVNIKGSVLNVSCNVNNNSVDVDLGTIVAQQYETAGIASDPKDVAIDLTGCSNTSTVTASFSGVADSTDPDLLAINSGSGAASNLAIQILDSTSNPVALGDTIDFPVTDSAATVEFKLRYKSTGTVTAGNADSTLNVDFAYQ
ncbi:fimbrial protein BcfF [Serratia quinivorans]|uniref:fimbrial protein n=1 Tax=Serratia quinivorans TaxID=137545 RepID=UPI00217B1634|nr:fimbrial protein [Serratia quinivorans]CAI1567657.1 fimbrial protein BcfF [Serratia quinivorans]CAI1695581.1 fimbrial protein BcfF [Serratia quinivorans]CAI1725047.1 fimbrial protein BcfF [Serratia quinivorans]